MNCRRWEEEIARYVDGALDRDEVREVERHLRSCPACAEFADRLEFDRAGLRTVPPECAEVDFAELRAGILRGIGEERRGVRWAPVMLLAASVLLAVAGAVWVRMPSVGRVDTPKSVETSLDAAGTSARATSAPERTNQSRDRQGAGPHPGRRLATRVPQPDPALEAALREFLAADQAPPPVEDPVSPVAIRITTENPNVVLILLQETSGESNE